MPFFIETLCILVNTVTGGVIEGAENCEQTEEKLIYKHTGKSKIGTTFLVMSNVS